MAKRRKTSQSKKSGRGSGRRWRKRWRCQRFCATSSDTGDSEASSERRFQRYVLFNSAAYRDYAGHLQVCMIKIVDQMIREQKRRRRRRRRGGIICVFSNSSSMSGSLGGSMGGSCLQQRAEGYPAYVFHEPLHSLTQSYSHAHSAAAHSQPHRGIPTSHVGTPTTPGGQPTGPGSATYQPTTSTATGESIWNIKSWKYWY